ncbi:MAG: DUF2339 domain-containing protein [Puia sp.]|nr:DUF2339 domain-containing protein [Puia sp.]
MDAIIILLFFIILGVILSLRKRVGDRITNLEEEIRRLQAQLDRFVRGMETKMETKEKEEKTVVTPGEQSPKHSPAQAPTQSPAKSLVESPAAVRSGETGDPLMKIGSGQQSVPVPPVLQNAHSEPGFFERHPDLEKFIGENLVSKIGIAILVLAIGFFVKYAIDNDWIGPIGRVGIGLLCGGILIALAHRMRNSYKAFSSVLVGGGLAILYFSVALAFHQYALFGQLVAFIIMLVITGFAVLLSLLYERQELAVIALVGGFASPFMASNGSGDYISLFLYLLILNTGLLVIAYFKAWRLLNLLAFVFTILLFSSWLFTLGDPVALKVYRDGLLFATLFYVLFFAINIAHTVRGNKRFIASDFGILLANTCVYSAAGLYLLKQLHEDGRLGLFSASMALFNLAASYFLFRKKKVDTNILYLLIGITLSFISLTAPIQLNGHYITLFWASESVVLYWLFTKSGIRILGAACLLVWSAMLISLFMDWENVYGSVSVLLPVVFNKGLMTTLYAALCCYALFRLQGVNRKKEGPGNGIRMARYATIVIGIFLMFGGGILEIHHQFSYYHPHTSLAELYLLLYVLGWSTIISYAASQWNWFPDMRYGSWLLVYNIVLYLLFISDVYKIQTTILSSGLYSVHFMAHWAGALLVAGMIVRLTGWIRNGKMSLGASLPFVTWLSCAVTVIFLSAEIQLIVNQLFHSPRLSFAYIQQVYIKAGLPVLWGLCSFGFMWAGMRNKFRPLRIISLSLFSITLLKLFLFDIRDIPVTGKIAAFFCLGVLLLVVSFMYQRLRKILIAEDGEKKNE